MSPTHQDLSNDTTFSQIESRVPVPLSLGCKNKFYFFIYKITPPFDHWGSSAHSWYFLEQERKAITQTHGSKHFQFVVALDWLEGGNLEKNFICAAALAASIAGSILYTFSKLFQPTQAEEGMGRFSHWLALSSEMFCSDIQRGHWSRKNPGFLEKP